MTLILIDGYDYLPSSNLAGVLSAQAWTGSVGALRRNTNTAFSYGYSLSPDGVSNANTYYRYARARHTTSMVWGMRMWVPASTLPTLRIGAHDTQSVGATSQWSLGFDSFGCLYFYNSTGLVAKTSAYSFYPERWFYLEISWTPGYSTDGTFEVRVNTVPVLSLPAVRTAAGTLVFPATSPGFDMLFYFVDRNSDATGANSWAWDDEYLLTKAGAQNDDYLGNVRAKYMAPVSDGSPLQWTIGGSAPAATNWQSVLNTALNDTKYVYASTVGFQDLYGIDPNLNTPQVFGVEVSGAYRQDDATQRWVKNTISSGGTLATGVPHAINQSFTFYPDIYELNPDTGVAFTGAEVNALLIGPEVDV